MENPTQQDIGMEIVRQMVLMNKNLEAIADQLELIEKQG